LHHTYFQCYAVISMRRLLVLFVVFLLFVSFVPFVQADSERAYQDYLYQFDLYRQKNSEFTVARNEYEKFKSLSSQTTALEKTTAMLSQRDLLIRAYLLLLNEKLNEDRGLPLTDKSTYQTLIGNEVLFLEGHSKLVGSIGSLEDANNVSKDLESHNAVLQASIRQTITGISLGSLAVLSRQFDTVFADAKAIISNNRGTFTPQKQATIDRWIIQIQNIRSLYQQKIDSINRQNAQVRGTSIDTQDELFRTMKNDLAQARQYLSEGSAFIGELLDSLRFQN